MTGLALGFSREKTTVPAHRGERIAAWLAEHDLVEEHAHEMD